LTRRVPWWAWVVALLIAAPLVGLATADPRARLQLALFLGRFHPLLVHLPIGGLVVAAALALASRVTRHANLRAALAPVLILCAVSAVAAVAAGQLLAVGATYDGSTFAWHRGLGYAVALVSILAAVSASLEYVHDDRRLPRLSDGLLGIAVALLMVTGHLGGTLTHGPEYLTEHMPGFLRGLTAGGRVDARATGTARPEQVVTYHAVVAPILEARCNSCHGPDKMSGGLRLDTPEHIRKGGSSGAVLTDGQALRSELIRRIWLPVSHRDVMPPKERPPITVAEANVLCWWVDAGASFDATLADVEIAEEVLPAIEARVGVLALGGPAVLALDSPPPDAAVVADLSRRGIPVSRLSEDASLLQVQARGRAQAFGDAEVEALLPVAAQVTWLDLGGTAVTDEALQALARFPHLSRLHLDRTLVTDEGLAHLSGLAHLEYLNLYATSVTDAGIEPLARLPELRTIYLWQTGVTAAGVEKLQAALPKLAVNAGPAEQAP
jgi:uncharacterized membrane protein